MPSMYFDGTTGNDFGSDDYYAMYGNAEDDSLISIHAGYTVIDGGSGSDALAFAGSPDIYGAIYGGEGDDLIYGYRLADELYGGAGTDVILGGEGSLADLGRESQATDTSGNDYIEAGSGSDAAYGFDGNDAIYGGMGDDSGVVFVPDFAVALGDDTIHAFKGGLFGGDGNDYIDGGPGADLIDGGLGRDTLIGGPGKDVFDFDARAETKLGALRDAILDFRHSQGDTIDLSTIDADTHGSPGNQKFKFIGKQAFHHVDGELRFLNGIVSGDTNGDGNADFQIKIVGVSSLYGVDLVL